ncbi:major capsid protein [Capybara microvirus Cap3_SP_457]|nr:major capsid protein [Capybara microvirus Cap3_SP_457]
MNRNVESHFANLPQVDIQRSIFDRSHRHLTTFNVGEVIPIFWDEVLPGDTVQMTTSKVIRLQTLITPIFDNIFADTYWFFVPNRLIWDHWKEFCGENNQSAWLPTATYTVPQCTIHNPGFTGYALSDYLGCPTPGTSDPDYNVSALPFRAYDQIMNDFFRSDVLTDPLNLYHGDATKYNDDFGEAGMPFRAARYHDYFSSALPAPQRGPAVSIGNAILPAGTKFPVGLGESDVDWSILNSTGSIPSRMVAYPGDSISVSGVPKFFGSSVGSSFTQVNPLVKSTGFTSDQSYIVPSNLYANQVDNLSLGSVSVSDLRLAFAVQKFLERDARSGGGRYPEYLKAHYGVVSPDASLQRPQYLGGNRIPLNVNQVANQALNQDAALGDLGAMSHTQDVHSDFVHSFTEHGILMGLVVLRYDHTYSQGIYRGFKRKQLYDFYDPLFASLSEQPIMKTELYYKAPEGQTFAYQECWSEYRFSNNRVSAEMRPGISGSLDSWHLADYYAYNPTLSDDWLRESKSNVDRVLAVTSSQANQCLADFYFSAKWTRPMPMYSIPGLIDHH